MKSQTLASKIAIAVRAPGREPESRWLKLKNLRTASRPPLQFRASPGARQGAWETVPIFLLLVSFFLLLCIGSQDSYAQIPADQPVERTDRNSKIAHAQLLEKAKQGRVDIYFEGDSITRRWGATDYPELLANWNQNFFGWNAANFAWGADTTQNILWRLNNGELDGVNPQIIVLLAGTNNVGNWVVPDRVESKVEGITKGIEAIIRTMQTKAPDATIIVMGIFPRNDNMAVIPTINKINRNLSKLADGEKIRYLNINNKLADSDGRLFDGMTIDRLHPSIKAYQIWADALKPIFLELLGPPAKEDHAPPPTGDPSAQRPKAPGKRPTE
jgi:lysophospholipase L1-like esterase